MSEQRKKLDIEFVLRDRSLAFHILKQDESLRANFGEHRTLAVTTNSQYRINSSSFPYLANNGNGRLVCMYIRGAVTEEDDHYVPYVQFATRDDAIFAMMVLSALVDRINAEPDSNESIGDIPEAVPASTCMESCRHAGKTAAKRSAEQMEWQVMRLPVDVDCLVQEPDRPILDQHPAPVHEDDHIRCFCRFDPVTGSVCNVPTLTARLPGDVYCPVATVHDLPGFLYVVNETGTYPGTNILYHRVAEVVLHRPTYEAAVEATRLYRAEKEHNKKFTRSSHG